MTATATTPALDVTGLRKTFGDTVALDGVDLRVPAGTVFALLGPNGAGKTTTVHILSTLLGADAGNVRVAGHDPARDPDAVRRQIGVTGQFSAVDKLLTPEENLALMADLHHLDRGAARRRIDELLERFDLADAAQKPVATFSGGMQRRLDLAMTLVGSPRIIFLDEPTTGLDPRSRRTVWRIVREVVDDGVTIFLTTHYLEEADRLADRIAVLHRGRVIAEGAPDELKRLIPGGAIRLHFLDDGGLTAAARVLDGDAVDRDALTLEIASDGSSRSLREVLDRLERAAIEVERVSMHAPDLDDVFLTLTGEEAGVEERDMAAAEKGVGSR
jgi:ABC-2 type transport system ATP-binding protein